MVGMDGCGLGLTKWLTRWLTAWLRGWFWRDIGVGVG